jgi:hypothetical protein
MGDTQLELLLCKVTEKHGLLGQRTVELDHQRFVLSSTAAAEGCHG